MQVHKKHYDKEKHDKFKALVVKQPYASNLLTVVREDAGINFGLKSIEVRSANTHYRGDILICSSQTPKIPGLDSGATIGIVELYGVKPISEFTAEDWKNTTIPPEIAATIKKGFGWLVRNPRRVVEMPVKGFLGIFDMCFTKDSIVEYPVVMEFSNKDIKPLLERGKNEKDGN